MSIPVLLLRSRVGVGFVVAFVTTQGAAMATAWAERTAIWPHLDLSGYSAVAAPGVLVAVVFMLALSRIADWEKPAQPLPHAVTIAYLTLLAGLSASLLIAIRGPDPATAEYTNADLVRNYAVYLIVGLSFGLADRWAWAPPAVAMTTVVALGTFGITRSLFPFAPLVLPSGGWLLAAAAVLVAVLTCLSRLAIDHVNR